MRDFVAGLVAVALLMVALSMATALRFYRRRRQRAIDSERALGRTIVAEVPTAGELVLFSEDAKRFYFGDRAIDKDLITAVRVLINGSPIAAVVSRRRQSPTPRSSPIEAARGETVPAEPVEARDPGIINDHPEGIARDRWDVAIETVTGTVLIECGAIRERISQELARAVFDAVKRAIA